MCASGHRKKVAALEMNRQLAPATLATPPPLPRRVRVGRRTAELRKPCLAYDASVLCLGYCCRHPVDGALIPLSPTPLARRVEAGHAASRLDPRPLFHQRRG